MSLSREVPYLGDQAVRKFLANHQSRVPFHVVRLRILGALASPNRELVPMMVFASFWPEGNFPRFETQKQSETFFNLFMGLWQRIEKQAADLSPMLETKLAVRNLSDIRQLLMQRIEELDGGFLEGFWGGCEDLPMTSAMAALIDGLSLESEWYASLLSDLTEISESEAQGARIDSLLVAINERDQICEDAMASLLVLKSKSQSKSS